MSNIVPITSALARTIACLDVLNQTDSNDGSTTLPCCLFCLLIPALPSSFALLSIAFFSLLQLDHCSIRPFIRASVSKSRGSEHIYLVVIHPQEPLVSSNTPRQSHITLGRILASISNLPLNSWRRRSYARINSSRHYYTTYSYSECYHLIINHASQKAG